MPPIKPPAKNDRIYIRATSEQKSSLARAARARHLKTTEFVLQVSLQAAEDVLAEEERITVSEREFARFVESLNNPAPPTPELRAAMEAFQTKRKAHPEANL